MPTDLRINTSLGAVDLERQQLEAEKAVIEARLAALSSSAPPRSTHQQQHRIQKHQRRNSHVSRTTPSTGATMARHLSSDRIEVPSQRSRTLSQRSAPSMARTNSRGTSSGHGGNMPFTQTGVMPPPLPSEPRETPAIETWMKDPSLPSYTFTQQSASLQRSTSQLKYDLEQVPEVGENPAEYVARIHGTPTLSISPPFSTSSATLNDHLSAGSFNIATPSTPTSLTTATTLPSNMSRQNSLCNEPVVEGFSMMRFNSNHSYSTDANSSDQLMFDQFPPHFTSSRHNRCSSSEEQSQLLVGAGGASNDSQFSHSFSSAEYPSSYLGEKMEKSQSNESMSSTSSAASSRSKQRLQASLAAERPIMPKGGSDENSMSRANSSQSMARLESKDGSQDKVAISKPSYQRPKHERVFCKQCENHPDGFRGEHELRRHQDREHMALVKKWICIEPTGQGHPKPELPLSKCKACGVQKKKYGAYYNAAAHLRRTHFKPKAKGARKSSKVDDGDKRGGKAGGDWPPMTELKAWMKEVEEPAEYPLAQSQQDEIDLSDDEANENFEEQNFDPQPMSHLGNNNFNDVYIPDTSPILNMYQSVPNDMYSMQSMPIDLPTQQSSYIDSSMYSQSFPTFSSHLTNDPMVLFTPSSVPQSVDDQFAGQDFGNFPFS